MDRIESATNLKEVKHVSSTERPDPTGDMHHHRIGTKFNKENHRRRLEGDRDCCLWGECFKCAKPSAWADHLYPEALQRNVGSWKPAAHSIQRREPYERGKDRSIRFVRRQFGHLRSS